MPIQIRRRIKILPGVHLNLSKSGISVTIGPKGLKYNVGPRGQYLTASLPGTGVYIREKIGGKPLSTSKTEDSNTDLSPVNALPPSATKSVQQFHKGLIAYFDGRYSEGLAHFQSLIEEKLHLPDALLMAGLCAYFLEQPESAIDYLQSCLESTQGEQPVPGHADSLSNQFINDKVLFSVPVTRFAVAELPYTILLPVFLLVELVQVYGQLDNAIEIAQQFQDNVPADYKRLMQLSLAELYYTAEQFDALKQLFVEQVGQIENEDNIAVEMMFYWAASLTKQEQYEAAKDVYTRALRKTKDRDPELLKLMQYARADMFIQWGKKAEAKKYFEKLYALDPSFAGVDERLKQLS